MPAPPTRWYSSDPVLTEPPPVLILAGGQGSRLRAADDAELATTPKLLVRLASGRPMLGHTLASLTAAGLRRICLLIGADPGAGGDLIHDYALSHAGEASLGILRERQPLGTAGAVYAALTHLRDRTAVITPADTLFPFEQLPRIITTHLKRQPVVTWAVTSRPGPAAQNVGRLRAHHGVLTHADETRPAPDHAGAEPVTSVGVMVITAAAYRKAFAAYARTLPAPAPVDLYRDLAPWLLATGHRIAAADIACPAPDLGTPERLRAFGRTPLTATRSLTADV